MQSRDIKRLEYDIEAFESARGTRYFVNNAVYYDNTSDTLELIVEQRNGTVEVFDLIEDRQGYMDHYTAYHIDYYLSINEFKELLKNRINIYLRHRGMWQYDVAEETGLSSMTVSNLVTGKSLPSLYSAYLLARALRCQIHKLICVYDYKHSFTRHTSKDFMFTEDEVNRLVADNIMKRMSDLEINKRQMCLSTSMSRSLFDSYLKGVNTPNLYNIYKIAMTLECSIDDLFYFDENI